MSFLRKKPVQPVKTLIGSFTRPGQIVLDPFRGVRHATAYACPHPAWPGSGLALAYTVHVMDVYDHYKFRAVLEQQKRDAMLAGKPAPKKPKGQGFLNTDDSWQDLYITGKKGDELNYFLSGL